jgi:predicted regulator of Ras-like GTPase activity (Roadblock/LC7/MglB family)
MTSDLIIAIETLIANEFDRQSRIQIVALATQDGKSVCMRSNLGANRVKLAALSSTMLSMSNAAVRETGGTSPLECLVSHDQGLICFRKIGPAARFVLCVASSPELNLGMLVSTARRLGDAIGKLLDQPTTLGPD